MLVDPEWLKKDKDKAKPPMQLIKGMWVDDIFRTAPPYRTPFQIMNLNDPKFWVGGSGQKIRHYRQLLKDVETWRNISVKLPNLLRHIGPSFAYKSAIPCDTYGGGGVPHRRHIAGRPTALGTRQHEPQFLAELGVHEPQA